MHETARSALRSFLYVFVALALVGCSDLVGPDETDHAGEDRGQRLAGLAMGGVWSPDGREIFYSAPTGIKAVDVESGASRLIVERQGDHISVTDDGRWIYVGHWRDDADGMLIARYPMAGGDGEPVLVTTGNGFAVSGDGGRVIFEDSTRYDPRLRLLDLGTQSSRTLGELCCPLAFEPGGATALVWEWDAGVRRVDLADGSNELTWARPGDPFDHQVALEDWRWADERSLQILYRDGPALHLFEEGTGSRRIASPGGSADITAAALSPDGARAVAWKYRDCLEPASVLGGCNLVQYRLFLIDVQASTVSVIGQANLREPPTRPVFSPDGVRVAFSLDLALYIKELPD